MTQDDREHKQEGKKVVKIFGVQKEENGKVYLSLPSDAVNDLDYIAAQMGTDRDNTLNQLLEGFLPYLERVAEKETHTLKGRIGKVLNRKQDPPEDPTYSICAKLIHKIAAHLRETQK